MHIISLTIPFFLGSININRHIISGCDSGRICFHQFKGAKKVVDKAFGHILFRHKFTSSTCSLKYLHTIDDIRVSISDVD